MARPKKSRKNLHFCSSENEHQCWNKKTNQSLFFFFVFSRTEKIIILKLTCRIHWLVCLCIILWVAVFTGSEPIPNIHVSASSPVTTGREDVYGSISERNSLDITKQTKKK